MLNVTQSWPDQNNANTSSLYKYCQKKSLVMNLDQKCPEVCCISCCTHHSQVVENISLRENLRKHQLRNVIWLIGNIWAFFLCMWIHTTVVFSNWLIDNIWDVKPEDLDSVSPGITFKSTGFTWTRLSDSSRNWLNVFH